MVIVSVFGGLGNQMFQYAFGRAISKKRGAKLDLDFYYIFKGNFLKSMTPREFDLGNFRVSVNKLSIFESIILRIFNLKIKFIENNFSFDNKLFENNSEWFVGYWQSYKYFEEIRKDLLNEFEPIKLSNKSSIVLKKILETNSVSVHIRRGDYLNKSNSNFFSNLSESNYYSKAIDLILKKIKNPVFFVFSDDLEWVKKNISFYENKVIFVDFNTGKNSYEDMVLMSRCKHNIIANSSFSWWGAWLNQNKNALIISPKKWFFGKEKSTKDLIPKKWVQI